MCEARAIRALCDELGLHIWCLQPLRDMEGHRDPAARADAMASLKSKFPFMRIWGAEMIFMCSATRTDDTMTGDADTVAADLSEMADLAAAFSRSDGGPIIKIGYEHLVSVTKHTCVVNDRLM